MGSSAAPLVRPSRAVAGDGLCDIAARVSGPHAASPAKSEKRRDQRRPGSARGRRPARTPNDGPDEVFHISMPRTRRPPTVGRDRARAALLDPRAAGPRRHDGRVWSRPGTHWSPTRRRRRGGRGGRGPNACGRDPRMVHSRNSVRCAPSRSSPARPRCRGPTSAPGTTPWSGLHRRARNPRRPPPRDRGRRGGPSRCGSRLPAAPGVPRFTAVKPIQLVYDDGRCGARPGPRAVRWRGRHTGAGRPLGGLRHRSRADVRRSSALARAGGGRRRRRSERPATPDPCQQRPTCGSHPGALTSAGRRPQPRGCHRRVPFRNAARRIRMPVELIGRRPCNTSVAMTPHSCR